MPNQIDFVFFDIGGTLGDRSAAGNFVAFPSSAGLLQSRRELGLRVGIESISIQEYRTSYFIKSRSLSVGLPGNKLEQFGIRPSNSFRRSLTFRIVLILLHS